MAYTTMGGRLYEGHKAPERKSKMLVKDVLTKYHKEVPFPWTLKKIKKAGLEPVDFLIGLGRELQKCEDIDTPTGQYLITLLANLELFG